MMTKGLALRWLTIGPFATTHLNTTKGFAGLVEQLGPMMRKMGQDARTDDDWGADMVARIHDGLSARIPVAAISEWQAWRGGRILAIRAVQDQGEQNQLIGSA